MTTPPAAPARKVLLLVAISPSDLTETQSTAQALAARGHEVTLVYLYSGHSEQAHRSSLAKLAALHGAEPGLQTLAINVDESQQVKEEKIRARLAAGKLQGNALSKPSSGVLRLLGVTSGLAVVANRWVERLRSWMHRNGSLAVYHGFLRLLRGVRKSATHFVMVHSPSLYTLIVMWPLLKIYKSYRSMFGVLLDQKPYQAILVPEDVVGPIWPSLIQMGLLRKVPTVILPYTLANQEEAFKSLRTHETVQTRHNRLAAYFFPTWRMRQAQYDVVRLPAGHVLVHEWLKISPPDPWMMNSGQAARVCVDSQASYDYFHKSGIAAEKLMVTGSVSQDKLAHVLQHKAAGLSALRDQLGLQGDKPLLLLSGCPNQLAGKVPFCEFACMQDLAAHVGDVLKALAGDYHLVVRPHPNYQEFGEFLKDYGVVSTLISTAELVPLCDLFIAFASATIRWASACGIPTINYDIFNYGYGDFAASKGVTTVCSAAEFVAVAAEMKPGAPRYKEARLQSQADAAYWSVMDGQGLQRIEEVIGQVSR